MQLVLTATPTRDRNPFSFCFRFNFQQRVDIKLQEGKFHRLRLEETLNAAAPRNEISGGMFSEEGSKLPPTAYTEGPTLKMLVN